MNLLNNLKRNKMKTALEWLVENMNIEVDFFELQRLKKVFEQAKELEKQQIKNAFTDGITGDSNTIDSEQYYNETYKTK